MEDYEEQEVEFWRKLAEEDISRGTMLRRSAAAAFGLTVLGGSSSALAATRARSATPPSFGSAGNLATTIANAKKEGHLNTIALPPDWANYGEMMSTFQSKYGIKITNANPDGSSAEENQAVTSLKGDSRAPDVVDDSVSFAIAGAAQGLWAHYKVQHYNTIPRAIKNTYGAWTGDYWGATSIGYNSNLVKTPPTSWQDLLKPAYKGQVALNGSPLTSGSAIGGVFAAALGNGGSLSNVQAGIDWFVKLKSVGNWVPVQSTPQTVASGQTPISIDWDYLNIAYTKQFPSAGWKTVIPSDGVYGAYYCQAINATAPHPWAARLWEEFCYSDQGQLIWLKGYSHPARFADLSARKVIPQALISALPSGALYSKVKFASTSQQTAAKALIAAQWPTKMA
jgi:putative spermidine/putrescine transport system substrate-binding protein